MIPVARLGVVNQAPLQLTLFPRTGIGQESDASERRSLPPRDKVMQGAEQIARQLSQELGVPVRLSVTDNRSTMVSFRRGPGALRLRLHHMFLEAPPGVVRAIADYAGRGRSNAGRVLDDFIRGQQPLIRRSRRGRGEALTPTGRCFDLQEMLDRLNRERFGGEIAAKIGWGRMPGRRRRKSIRLGVYDHQAREIRIHPALDRPEVPAFFVEFIVFHEMLHQLFPSVSPDDSEDSDAEERGGRRTHHPKAFRDREKEFPLYAAALRWERRNLRVLLHS